jgi:hypothetical protein
MMAVTGTAQFPRGVQIQSVFEKADAAGLLLYSKEPNTIGCDGYLCGEW